MKKLIIYTNDTCPYCKQVKEELKKGKVKFEERLTSEYKKEYGEIQGLTGMATVPTLHYKKDYFIAGRDFGNPKQLVEILKNYEPVTLDVNTQILERIKSLNYNISMAFNRLDQLLRQIENNTKKEENGNKGNS